MVSSSLLFFFSIAFAFILGSNAATLAKPHAFILPIYKNKATFQYYTNIKMGNPGMHMNVVIDLGAQFLWFGCDGNTLHHPTALLPVAQPNAKLQRALVALAALGLLDQVAPTTLVLSLHSINPSFPEV